jgi:hypothetical protein
VHQNRDGGGATRRGLIGAAAVGAAAAAVPATARSAAAPATAPDIFAVNVRAYSAKGDGRTDDTRAIQDAIKDATRPYYAARSIYIPPGIYRITGTIFVPSNTRIVGAGANYAGTTLVSTVNAPVFDCRSGTAASSAKKHTRVEITGIQFYKATNYASTAYTIDMTGGYENAVHWCSFGDNTSTGSMNGIALSGTAHWIDHCRFLHMGYAGLQSSGANAAIRSAPVPSVAGSATSHMITNCQFERKARVLLKDAKAVHIERCHFEASEIELRNSHDCSIRHCYMIQSKVRLDNKSNNNRLEGIAGGVNHLVNLGSNCFERCDFAGVGRNVHSFGPFNAETSPLRPDVIATTWNAPRQLGWGAPGDVILFAVQAMPPGNTAPTTDTIDFVRTSDGAVIHASPSITLSTSNKEGAVPQDSETWPDTYTYWALLRVPSGAKIGVSTQFRTSVWAGKAVNPNPFMDSLTDWGGSPSAGNHTSKTGCTPSMNGQQLLVSFSKGTGWAVTQYMRWPNPLSKRYLYVLRGRWAANLGVSIATGDASSGADNPHTRQRWQATDESFNLQTSDRMLFMVTDINPASNAFAFSFGGYGTDFPANPQIALDWAAIVPLD